MTPRLEPRNGGVRAIISGLREGIALAPRMALCTLCGTLFFLLLFPHHALLLRSLGREGDAGKCDSVVHDDGNDCSRKTMERVEFHLGSFVFSGKLCGPSVLGPLLIVLLALYVSRAQAPATGVEHAPARRKYLTEKYQIKQGEVEQTPD